MKQLVYIVVWVILYTGEAYAEDNVLETTNKYSIHTLAKQNAVWNKNIKDPVQ